MTWWWRRVQWLCSNNVAHVQLLSNAPALPLSTRVTCGPKKFTCRQKCAELAYNPIDALVLPTPIMCPYDGKGSCL